MPNLYRIRAEQTCHAEALVISNDEEDAKLLFKKAILNGELEFDSPTSASPFYMDYCNNIVISEENKKTIEHEIKNYGVVNNEGKITYNAKIFNDLLELAKKKRHEEWLKKNHMEFNF